jgi:hypothetical protein
MNPEIEIEHLEARSAFLAANTEIPSSISGVTRFSE